MWKSYHVEIRKENLEKAKKLLLNQTVATVINDITKVDREWIEIEVVLGFDKATVYELMDYACILLEQNGIESRNYWFRGRA